jgi:deglycase
MADRAACDVDATDYDGPVIPGGVANPDQLRADEDAVQFVRGFFDQEKQPDDTGAAQTGEAGRRAGGKPVGIICHGPWMLVEAGVAHGRKVTSWPSLQTDLRNAGADWVDQEVVVDNGLVTSRKPDDLPAFCSNIVEQFATVGARA